MLAKFFLTAPPSVYPIVSDCFLCVFGKTDRPANRWIQILVLTIWTRVFSPFIYCKETCDVNYNFEEKSGWFADHDSLMSALEILCIPEIQSSQ